MVTDTDVGRALLEPRAIAILGASGEPASLFARPLRYLIDYGFVGEVYPVNPKYESIHGRKCFATLADVPGPVDLVLMLIPGEAVIEQLPAVAASGAKVAVVCAAGFVESGSHGGALQQQLAATARELGVRLIGPNCQGVAFIPNAVLATFTGALEHGVPSDGDVAYVGQSGAVGGAILSLAQERGLGISAWVSTGNQADLTAVEVAAQLVERPEIRVLALYFESPVEGNGYRHLLERAHELAKPVVVLRSARSDSGARAAASHTGAMLTRWNAFDALSLRYGVAEAEDVNDFIAIAHALSTLPRATGGRVAVVTTSGAAGSISSDQLDAAGLTTAHFTGHTRERLSLVVPAMGSIGNPVDVTAQIFQRRDAHEFARVCDIVLDDPEVDALLVVVTLVVGDAAFELAQDLTAMQKSAGKPVTVVWLAARAQTLRARELFSELGLPIAESMHVAGRALAALAARREPVARTSVTTPAVVTLARELVRRGRATGRAEVLECEAQEVFGQLAIARPAGGLATSAREAARIAGRLAGPLVMKVQIPGLTHKSDVGGVRVGVESAEVETVFDDLMLLARDVAPPLGVLVQEVVPTGPELIVGVTNIEAGFAPLITVGTGGVASELHRDIVTRLSPIGPQEAEDMIRALRLSRLITGYRGSPAFELAGAGHAIACLSQLAIELGENLVELEINPLRLTDRFSRPVALDFDLRLDLSSGT